MDEDAAFLHSVLLSLCVGIGHFENESFVVGQDSVGSLKDLKRLLKQDFYSSDRNAFLQLGDWNVIEKHLLPLFLLSEDHEILQLIGSWNSFPSCNFMIL